MKKRILSLVLALSLCTSLMVAPAHAAGVGNISLDVLKDIALWLEGVDDTSPNVNNATYARSHYTEYSYSTLEQAVFNWNAEARNFTITDPRFHLPSYSRSVYFDLQPLGGTDFYAIRCYCHIVVSQYDGYLNPEFYNQVNALGYWTDPQGNVAVCSIPTQEEAQDTSVKVISTSAARSSGAYRMLSYEDLYNLTYDYNQSHSHTRYSLQLNEDGFYWAIASNGLNVLANSSGLPYGAAGPTSVTASGNSRPDETTNDDHIIDWLNNLVGSNGGPIDFDNVIYDPANKTYYVDNSVSVVNNITNNYYFNWSYTYYVDNTYITYIGSSAEYTDSYECYYQLPDGRSSADLTAEELEQLNLNIDVIDYSRSTDDTRLRSLYHFDGNTEDSSFWNYQTSFDWSEGASLTYLESNAFNGCLYLDELTHDFTITLPSSLGSGDFTVDFRYYQSATETPQNDSFIEIGGQEVLRLDGSHFIFNGTNYATPVGSWQHLAFVRENSTLYFYLNGVRQGSKAFSSVLTSAIQFYFGGDQQTYKYLDELRVTNFAVWHTNFNPPTVPYDTNLSLVLPTDSIPVADEYYSYSTTGENLMGAYADWTSNNNLSFISNNNGVGSYSSSSFSSSFNVWYPSYKTWRYTLTGGYSLDFPRFTGITNFSFDITSDGTLLIGSGGDFYGQTRSPYSLFPSGFYTLLNNSSSSSEVRPSFSSYNGSYTFSFASGTDVYSASFNISSSNFITFGSSAHAPTVNFDYSSLGPYTVGIMYIHGYNSDADYSHSWSEYLVIIPTSDAIPISYVAFEQGSESTLTAEFHSAVVGIPEEDLNTPTLAVRSDIPTTDYQIGGVRPTFAERGQVYAMVESGYITSLQQYTGYAWQQVDGRIWTGSRWIPFSSYNVITLSDMYDIADASGQTGYEYIYSQSGFWSWWQKQWLEFKQWYTSLSFTGGGGDTVVEGDTINNDYDVDIDFGTARSNSVGLLQFIQTIFGDITSGFANFTSLYTSPDDSFDVLFPAEQTDE